MIYQWDNFNGYAGELQNGIDNNISHCNATKQKSFINYTYSFFKGNLDIVPNINLRKKYVLRLKILPGKECYKNSCYKAYNKKNNMFVHKLI